MDYQAAEPKDCCVPVLPYQSDALAVQWERDRDERRALLKNVTQRRAISNALRDNPEMLRSYQPPPPAVPQSVALLTAVGYLQDLQSGEPVDDLDELASNAGLSLWEIRQLLLIAEEKGYLTYEDELVSLTPKGWKWYEKHNHEQ